MSTAVANPRVTFNILSILQELGLEDHRNLIVGQMGTGSSTPGQLDIDLPRTDAEINERYGADSHLAAMCRWYRKINKITNVDVIPLTDLTTNSTAGVGKWVLANNATREGRFEVLVFGPDHRYIVDVLPGETPADVLAKLEARINSDNQRPFTFTKTATEGSFTATNKGNLSDSWPIVVTGRVPGMTSSVEGFTGGAGDPDLTGIFDVVSDIRYQGIVWPDAYDKTTLKNFIAPRRNVENDVKDGVGFIGINEVFTAAKATALPLNSSEIVLVGNKPNSFPDAKGSYLPQAPDLQATYVCAVRARRFEPDRSITDLVVTHEPNDQQGGIHTASLPYFNTPVLNTPLPRRGGGFSGEEQRELEESGVSVIGMNKSMNGIVLGPLVTTRLNDAAGNEDKSDTYLNWRDTRSIIREYQAINARKEYAQTRISIGEHVGGYSMVTSADVRAYLMELLDDLARRPLVVKGRKARRWMQERLIVDLQPDKRLVKVSEQVLMVSQLGDFIGNINFSFNYQGA